MNKKGVSFSIGSIIIFIMVFVCFIFAPSMIGQGNNGKALSFGKYNGKEIKYEQGSDFADYVSQISDYYRNRTTDISQYNYAIFSQAFNETVKKYAYEDAVSSSGYEVPDEAINRIVRSMPQFMVNGKFSEKEYLKADQSYIEDLKKSIKDYLVTSRFTDDNYGVSNAVGTNTLYGLKMSSAEQDFLASYNNDARGFNMVVFNKADYPADEKLKYAYANSAKFNQFNLSIINVEDKTTADTVLNRISNNEITFEDAVSEYSDSKYANTEGVLTNNYQYQIETILVNKEDLAKLTDLAEGSVSEVLETQSGFSIFKKNGAIVYPDFTNEELMNKVSAYIIGYESTMIEDYFTAKAKDFTTDAMATDFDTACAKYGYKNEVVEPFPLNYGNISIANTFKTDIDDLKNAYTNENFLKAAFSLKMNDFTEPLVVSNSIVVLQYTTSKEADEADADISALLYQVASIDETSGDTAVLASSKLENNFANTFFNEMYGD